MQPLDHRAPLAYMRNICCPTSCDQISPAQWHKGILPILRLGRTVPSLCGMVFHCHCDCSPGFILTHSTLALKLFSCAVIGSAPELLTLKRRYINLQN